jgi:hypothetical protein
MSQAKNFNLRVHFNFHIHEKDWGTGKWGESHVIETSQGTVTIFPNKAPFIKSQDIIMETL